MQRLFEIDNLDAVPADELRQLSVVLHKYSTYADLKAKAIEMRLAGNIQGARVIEYQLDCLYRTIPPEYRQW